VKHSVYKRQTGLRTEDTKQEVDKSKQMELNLNSLIYTQHC